MELQMAAAALLWIATDNGDLKNGDWAARVVYEHGYIVCVGCLKLKQSNDESNLCAECGA